MKVLITSRSFGKIGDSAKKVLTDAGIEIDNISVGFDQAHFEKIIPEFEEIVLTAAKWCFEHGSEGRTFGSVMFEKRNTID